MRNATRFCPTCNKVIITGHSLGASVASFIALRASEVMRIPRNRIQLLTSGGPRTGNGDFAREVQDSVGEIYRVVYAGDIVTQIPPLSIFQHFPREILVYPNGTQRLCSRTNGEDFSCSNRMVLLEPYRFVSINHLEFNGVLSLAMYARMVAQEPPTRWCGVAPSNSPGLGLIMATADETNDYDAQFDAALADQQEVVATSSQQPQTFDNLSTGAAVGVGICIFVAVLAIFGLGYVVVALARKPNL